MTYNSTVCDHCKKNFKRKDKRVLITVKTPVKTLTKYSNRIVGRYHKECFDKLFSGEMYYEIL